MNPFRVNTSMLYQQPPPSGVSQLMRGTGDIVSAMMARRREAERQAVLDQQKAAELEFRQKQEQRIVDERIQQTQREDARLQAQETRAQEDRRLKGYEAVGKAKPQDRAFLAQLYGGTMGQATPDYRSDPNDPLSKDIDFLENVQEDESSPLGFSYGVNPEHERRTAKAANTQTLTMPGGQPIELPNQEEEQDFYGRLALTLPDALLQRRLEEARAAGLDPKGTIGHIEDERQRQASERNARIVAGRQERASQLAENRADERDRAAAMKKLKALGDRANDADRELAIQEEIITRNKGVPVSGKDRVLYDQSVQRLSGSLALVESGNPESEASDPTKRAIESRVSSGRLGAAVAPIADFFGIETAGQSPVALEKIRRERAILRQKMQDRASAAGLPAPQMGGGAQYGPVTTKTTKKGETVRVRKNLSTGQWEEVQ